MDTTAGHRRRILALVAAITVLAFVVVGCSSGDSKSSSSSTSSSTSASDKPSDPSTPPSCPSATEVDKSLKAGLDKPVDQRNGAIRTCTYDTTAGGDQVVIRFETGVTPAAFAAAADSKGPSGESTTPVPGVGDSAFSMRREEPGSAVTEVAALSGTTLVSALAPVPLADVETLVKNLIASL